MSGILQTLFLGAAAAVKDAYFNLVTLLLNTTATNGAQNNTFLDSSTNNFTITRNGNTTQGTFTPFSQTGWSNFFGSSTSDRLTFTSNASYAVGTGNFTAECFVNFSSNSKTNQWMFNYGQSGQSTLFITLQSNVLSIPVGNSTVITYSFTPVVGTWYHIAVVRSGTGTNQVALYVDGVSVATGTSSASLGQYALGVGGIDWASDYNVNGYLSNVRYSNTARYTSNFTPATTPFTSDANTLLLTCQNNRFIDNSSLANTFTLGGSPSVQAFSPFAPTTAYDTAVVGGSGYFDGSGDYLTVTNATAFDISADFTVEFWFYPTSFPNTYTIVVSTDVADAFQIAFPSTAIEFYFNGSLLISGSVTRSTLLNAWHHIAVTRSGSSVALFLDGVRLNTGTSSASLNNGAMYIGYQGAGSAWPTFGYVSGFRLVKGSSVYSPSSTTLTIPTAPPTAITNTTLLLNFTNAGIYDATAKSNWETVNSVQVSTAQAKWGSTSFYFNGTANQRLLPSQNYQLDIFGTGDFTLECWLYVVAQGATSASGIWDQRPGVNGTYIYWTVDFGGYGQGSASNPKLVLYTNSAVFCVSGVLTMGTWNHVALCRASGTTRFFINGSVSGTPVSDTNNYLSGGSAGNYRPSIGCSDGGDSLYGYIDDFRATRYARYTTTFTPPTTAFPIQ